MYKYQEQDTPETLGLIKCQSAPVILNPNTRRRHSLSLINKYTTDYVPTSPRSLRPPRSPRSTNFTKQCVRNLDGQIAKLVALNNQHIQDACDPILVNQVLKGEREDYKIEWVDDLDFFVN